MDGNNGLRRRRNKKKDKAKKTYELYGKASKRSVRMRETSGRLKDKSGGDKKK
jgi:hypothetical protein